MDDVDELAARNARSKREGLWITIPGLLELDCGISESYWESARSHEMRGKSDRPDSCRYLHIK